MDMVVQIFFEFFDSEIKCLKTRTHAFRQSVIVVAFGAIFFRYALWLQRPATRTYFRRGLQLFFSERNFFKMRETRQKQLLFLLRALAIWLLIIFAESVHGTLRQIFLAPLIGDFQARRIAFFVGMLLIFAIACFFIRWIAAPSVKSLFVVGIMWMILTALFEFSLGLFVMKYSRERMFEDYDISRGGLMGFGLIFMAFAPYLAAKLRGTKPVRRLNDTSND